MESPRSVLYRRGAVLGGRRTADLRITRDDGQVVHWQVKLQNTIEGTTPDVEFNRVDGVPLTVAVYPDGDAYHAAPGKIRLASDADRRARLRAEGLLRVAGAEVATADQSPAVLGNLIQAHRAD